MNRISRLSAAALIAGCLSMLSSCSTLELVLADKNAWSSGPIPSGPLTVVLSDPAVDKAVDAASVESEICRLLPLLMAGEGVALLPRGSAARYVLDVRAVEREYASGWKSRRSMAVDLWLRESDGSAPFALRSPPVAASRVAASGDGTLSSSSYLSRLLSRACGLLVDEMRR